MNRDILLAKDLRKVYGDREVVKGISIDVKQGEVVGLLGPNGAGKTTTFYMITGMIKPNNGNIELDGKDMDKNFRAWQNSIGYVPQFVYLLDDTIKNNIGFGISEENIDIKKINESINLSQIGSFVETLDLGINTIVGEKGIKISGGQRQRIGIARAVYNSPEILVFDEPTSSLDEVTEKNFFDSKIN